MNNAEFEEEGINMKRDSCIDTVMIRLLYEMKYSSSSRQQAEPSIHDVEL